VTSATGEIVSSGAEYWLMSHIIGSTTRGRFGDTDFTRFIAGERPEGSAADNFRVRRNSDANRFLIG